MAAPPNINTLRSTDFPNGLVIKTDLDKLFQILNPYFSQLQAMGQNGVSFGSNTDGQIIVSTITTPVDGWNTMTLTSPFVAFGTGWPAPSWKVEGNRVFFRGLFAAASAPTLGQAFWTYPSAALMPVGATSGTGRLFAIPVAYNSSAYSIMGRLDAWSTQLNWQSLYSSTNQAFGSIGSTAAPTSVTFGSLDGVSWDIANGASVNALSCFPITVRVKAGKKVTSVRIASCFDTTTNQSCAVDPLPAYTVLGTGQQGNQLRIDSIQGLPLGVTVSVAFWVEFG